MNNYLTYLSVGYLVAFVALIAIIVYQEISHRSEIARMQKQNGDLMNRFMSRDFRDYAGGQRIIAPVTDVELAEQALGMDENTRQEADGLRVD